MSVRPLSSREVIKILKTSIVLWTVQSEWIEYIPRKYRVPNPKSGAIISQVIRDTHSWRRDVTGKWGFWWKSGNAHYLKTWGHPSTNIHIDAPPLFTRSYSKSSRVSQFLLLFYSTVQYTIQYSSRLHPLTHRSSYYASSLIGLRDTRLWIKFKYEYPIFKILLLICVPLCCFARRNLRELQSVRQRRRRCVCLCVHMHSFNHFTHHSHSY